MGQFILGVGASIVAALVIYISREAWGKYWHLIFSKVYPDISGRYKVINHSGPDYDAVYPEMVELLEIQQFGKQLRGSAVVLSNSTEKLSFAVSGFVTSHSCVVINYENTTAKNRETGSYVMTIEGVENRLCGHAAFLCGNCKQLHNYPVELSKVG